MLLWLRSICPVGYQIRTIKCGKILVMLLYGKYYWHVYEVYNKNRYLFNSSLPVTLFKEGLKTHGHTHQQTQSTSASSWSAVQIAGLHSSLGLNLCFSASTAVKKLAFALSGRTSYSCSARPTKWSSSWSSFSHSVHLSSSAWHSSFRVHCSKTSSSCFSPLNLGSVGSVNFRVTAGPAPRACSSFSFT